MDPTIPTNSAKDKELKPLEAQLRECFGRVVYSHKAHEKDADACLRQESTTKWAQILLSAVTTGGLVVAVLGDSKAATILSAVVSTLLLVLNAYTKEKDPGQEAQKHKNAADRLWKIRESYLSLLTDIRSGGVSLEHIRTRRDELQESLGEIYTGAPRTTGSGYESAQDALKNKEELTFSDLEIDKFLPAPLRTGAPRSEVKKQ